MICRKYGPCTEYVSDDHRSNLPPHRARCLGVSSWRKPRTCGRCYWKGSAVAQLNRRQHGFVLKEVRGEAMEDGALGFLPWHHILFLQAATKRVQREQKNKFPCAAHLYERARHTWKRENTFRSAVPHNLVCSCRRQPPGGTPRTSRGAIERPCERESRPAADC